MSAKKQSKLIKAVCAAAPAVCMVANYALPRNALATSFLYTPANGTDSWSTGTNWSATPTSGIDTILSFVDSPATVLVAPLNDTSTNDIAGFQLNQFDLNGTGPAAVAGTITAAVINIAGNALTFTNNGTTDPIFNLNAIAGSGLTYNVTTPLSLSNTLTFQGTGTANFNFYGGFSGVAGLTKTGSSTLNLFGNNSYGGTTTVNGGTLRVAQPSALPGFNAPGRVVLGGGTLAVTSGGTGFASTDIDTTLANLTSTTNSNFAINVDPANSFTYASNITNTVGITKSGLGTLTLSGNNSFTGNLVLAGGQLNLATASAIGASTFVTSSTVASVLDNTSGAPMVLTNNPVTLNATLNFAGSNDLNFANGSVTFASNRTIFARANTLTFGGPVNGSSFGLTKGGAGTLALTNPANVFGDATLLSGVLSVGTTGVLGTGDLTLAGGELRIEGAANSARAITVGTLNSTTGATVAGRSVVTLVAGSGGSVTLTANAVGTTRGAEASTLYRGTNLGTAAPGPNVTNIFLNGLTVNAAGAGTVSGTNFFASLDGVAPNGSIKDGAVLRGALYDPTATGNGQGANGSGTFATYDSTVGVRGLTGAEQINTMTANDNVRLDLTATPIAPATAGSTSFVGAVVNTLQINNTSGVAQVASFSTATANSLGAVNGLLFTGTSTITLSTQSAQSYGSGATVWDMVVLSTNTAGATMADMNTAASGQRGYLLGGPGLLTLGNLTGGGSNGAVTVVGPGTTTFNGAVSTSSSNYIVTGGATLKFGPNFTVNTGSSARQLLIAGGSTVDMNGRSMPVTSTFDGLTNYNGTGGVLTNSATGAATTFNIAHNNAGTQSTAFSGLITGNLNLNIAFNASATTTATANQVLANANTYTGTTTVASGTLLLGATNALPATTPLIINGGGTFASVLDLGGYNDQVNSLSGTLGASAGTLQVGTIQNNTANTTSIFTVGGSGAGTFAGAIIDNTGAGGKISLVRSGSGSLTLSGTGSYTGTTTVSGGTLRVNGALTGPGQVTVSGGTLGGTGTIAGPVVVNSGGHVAPGAGIGTLTLTNSLTLAIGSELDYEFIAPGNNDVIDVSAKNNGFTLNGGVFNLLQNNSSSPFSDPNKYQVIKFSGTVQGTGLDSSWTTSSPTNPHVLDPQLFKSYAFDTTSFPGFLTLNITSTTTTGTWSGTAGSSWATAGAGGNWSNGAAPAVAGDTAIFPSGASTFTVALNGSRTVGAITLNSSTPYTIQQGSSGTLFLDESTATAVVNDANGSHSITAPVSLSSNTNVNVVNASDTLTISGNISGTGALTKTGSGTLALGGTNTHASTIINGGTVLINADANLGNSPTTINAGALATATSMITPRNFQVGNAASTIDVEGAATTYQLNGTITDGALAGTLNKTGPGTLVLNGSASNTGGIAVTSGTVQLGTGGATGGVASIPANIGGSGTLVVNRTGTTTLGALSGTGSLTNQVSGSNLTLAGNNTSYSGNISATNSTLTMGNASGIGSASLILNNATLTQQSASTNALIFNGGTTSNSFSGLTVVNAATLDANGGSMGIGAQLSGSGTITHIGTGTVSLGAGTGTAFSNSFFGGTFVNVSGDVDFASRISGSRNASWSFIGGSVTIGNAGGSNEFGYIEGSVPITNTTGAVRLAIGSLNGNSSYSGNITGTSVGLAKFGTGTLVLSGQNQFSNNGVTFTGNGGGYNVVINSGTLVAASSTNGGISGPLGGSATYVSGSATASLNGTVATGSPVLLGAANQPTSAALMTSGPVTVANDITVSGGGGTLATAAYTLSLGGVSDNSSTLSGKVLLQNNLTVSQVATTGNHALNLTGGMYGVVGTIGPNDTGSFGMENTGFQTVTFAGAGRVNVSGVIADIDPNPMNFIGLNEAGTGGTVSLASTGGVTNITGANNYSGATTAAGGTLILGKNAQNPVLSGPKGAIVNSGALILDYSGGGTDPVSTVQSILASGNGNNFQSGQIRTTNAPNANNAIGYVDANSQVLIRYASRGDANLDGVVNALDFNAVATNFGGSSKVWSQGDFNYDGSVNTLDFVSLASNFGTVLPASVPAPVLGTLVPEPASFALAAVGLLAMRRRRNRSSF